MSDTDTPPFRKGDVVSITGKIKYSMKPNDSYVYVTVDHALGEAVAFPLDKAHHITLIAPHFDIGERVVTVEGSVGYVRAIVGRYAWFEREGGSDRAPFTVDLADLTAMPLLADTKEAA